jgi:hypothetical protein
VSQGCGWWGRRRQAVGADELLRVLLTMAPTEFRGPFGISTAVDTRAQHNTTPLMVACLHNHPMAVRTLIAEGANTRLTCEVHYGLVTPNWKVRAHHLNAVCARASAEPSPRKLKGQLLRRC